jgi:hypothetical protein
MTPQLTLVHDHMGPSLLRYAEVMGRTLKSTVERAAKGVTRRVIDLTPPASQGITGAAAYRAGRVRIARQMSAVLAPVKLKGQRKITVVFGRKLRRPVTIATREKYPNVAALYKTQLTTRVTGAGLRLKDFRGQKFYVDIRKFETVLKDRQSRVGRLAAGWAPAAEALDLPVQNWISRHGGGRGTIARDLNGAKMRIAVRNFATGLPANLRSEMERRIGYAVKYQGDAMKREVDYYAGKVARDLAIKTRNFSALVPEGMQGG